MFRRVAIVLAVSFLGPLPSSAQISLPSPPLAATEHGAVVPEPGNAVSRALPSLLAPSGLPPLDLAGRVGGDRPFHPAYREGITVGWPSKPVNRENDSFQWDSYLKHNLHMLTWQHSYRVLAQEKTRSGLRQPVFPQWGANIEAIPQGWGDGDGFVTNYVGHPYMGSIMGFLQGANHPVHSRLEFGDAGYWQARSAALAASAIASTQFEIGPLSEASLGLNPSKQGLVDFVVTPLLGTGLLVAEDALDRYVIAKLEAGKGKGVTRFVRCALNPGRMAANLFAFRAPWHRDTR
jgi:hypothetical protein